MLHRLPDRQGYNSPWFGYRLTPPCLQSSKPNLARIVDSPAGISDAVGTPNPPPGLRPSSTTTLIFRVSRISRAFPSFPGRHDYFPGTRQSCKRLRVLNEKNCEAVDFVFILFSVSRKAWLDRAKWQSDLAFPREILPDLQVLLTILIVTIKKRNSKRLFASNNRFQGT